MLTDTRTAPVAARIARPRHVLLCRPTYFDVRYSINPWMDPTRPTSTARGLAQWQALHDTLVRLGHDVQVVDPDPALPDMVFAANGATVVDGRVLVARFRHEQRQGETEAYAAWFRAHGWEDCQVAEHVNEGEGDLLFTGSEILAGTGSRTEPAAHDEVAAFFDRPVLGLRLIDPRYYHLDTALSVLDRDLVMYYPAAFDDASRRLLESRFPDAVLADAEDAAVFGLNAFSDGRHVLLPEQAQGLAAKLRERGFEPVGLDLTELLKAGGSVKCCILELRR